MPGDHPGGFVPTRHGRQLRARVRRGEVILSAADVRRAQLERPERDERQVAADVTRPDEPGGEQRCR